MIRMSLKSLCQGLRRALLDSISSKEMKQSGSVPMEMPPVPAVRIIEFVHPLLCLF